MRIAVMRRSARLPVRSPTRRRTAFRARSRSARRSRPGLDARPHRHGRRRVGRPRVSRRRVCRRRAPQAVQLTQGRTGSRSLGLIRSGTSPLIRRWTRTSCRYRGIRRATGPRRHPGRPARLGRPLAVPYRRAVRRTSSRAAAPRARDSRAARPIDSPEALRPPTCARRRPPSLRARLPRLPIPNSPAWLAGPCGTPDPRSNCRHPFHRHARPNGRRSVRRATGIRTGPQIPRRSRLGRRGRRPDGMRPTRPSRHGPGCRTSPASCCWPAPS